MRENPASMIVGVLSVAAGLLLFAVTASAERTTAQRLVISRDGQEIISLTVEVVIDRSDREQGLSGRPSLAPGEGMLFVMERDISSFFWMKSMRFPVDLLFFDGNRRLLSVLPGLQPCETDCVLYQPPVETAYALEVNAGIAAAAALTVGDRFEMQ